MESGTDSCNCNEWSEDLMGSMLEIAQEHTISATGKTFPMQDPSPRPAFESRFWADFGVSPS